MSEDQQKQIEQWLAALGTPQQVALRGRIVIAAGDGKPEAAIAAAMRVGKRFVSGANAATYSAEKIQAVIDATLQSKPKGMTHWSCRLGAAIRA